MVLDFDKLYMTYKLNIRGVIHIGAHFGTEYDAYTKHKITDCLFFEPLPHTFDILKNNIGNNKNVILINKALGNDNMKIDMFVEQANQGQSSSILKPELHLKQYPHIIFNNKVSVDMITLDSYSPGKKYNFINIDVQGYELEVFKGSEKTLMNIDYIMAEVNKDNLYENCTKVWELDSFLGKFGFTRVETNWIGNTWGDAFYIKNKKLI